MMGNERQRQKGGGGGGVREGLRGATPEGRDGEWLRKRQNDGASWVPREPFCEDRPGYNGVMAVFPFPPRPPLTPPTHPPQTHPTPTTTKKRKASALEDYPFHY